MTSQQQPLGAPRQDEYRTLRESDLRDYLAQLPAVSAQLGGSPAAWSISEVGDGNLNLVFIVRGTSGGIAVKQALPYPVFADSLSKTRILRFFRRLSN